MTTWYDVTDVDQSTLEDIEFLSRSPHRFEVLDALAKAPRTRHDLRDRADVSRVTIRRLLDDLEQRGWLVHTDGQYEATARGRVVAQEFARLSVNLTTATDLDDALPWLPTDEFDFDLVHLRDADVLTTSSWPDHAAAVSHAKELVRGVNRIRGSSIGWTPEVVEVIREQVVAGETTFEVVVGDGAFGMMQSEPSLRQRFRDILDADQGSMFRYNGEAPLHMVMTMDETVVVCGHVDDGPPPGTLETENERVLAWARRYFDSVRSAAQPLHVEALVPEQQ